MSARKSSHGTIFLIVSNGSPLALIASSLRSTSKKPVCPMTRSLHPPMAHCGQRVRFVATWREEFFKVPFNFLFSASAVRNGKPAPDLFLHAASRMGVQAADCIVVEDSPAGVAAATAAGMAALGFVGGSHAGAQLGEQLILAGARTIVADLRHLKSAVVALRGW